MPFSKDFEFRPVTKEERPRFDEVVRYVFANTTAEPEADDDLKNDWTTAAFYKGKLVAASGGYPCDMQFNGRVAAVDALTAVGTEPGFRRMGLVRRMVTQRLNMVHEQSEQSASILWASMGAIYQRFGYGLGSTHAEGRFDPNTTQFQFPAESGGYVRITSRKEGMPIVKKLYDRFIQDRTLDLHRDKSSWKEHMQTKKTRSFGAIYYNKSDRPEGYITYKLSTFNPPNGIGPNQRLEVQDYIYLNIEAYRGLWGFMASHDLVGRVVMDLPVDDPAFHLLLEPRNLRISIWDGIWLRVVDVDQFLTRRHYSLPGEVVFEIKEDQECPWNVRKYLLKTDGINTEVSKTRKSTQFRITPNGLAGVLTGNTTLSQMDTVGRASVLDKGELPKLDAMFATKYRPFCRDDF